MSSFLSYANQYTKPFNEISGVVTEFQNAIACAQRVFELIEEEPQIPEPEQAVVLTHLTRHRMPAVTVTEKQLTAEDPVEVRMELKLREMVLFRV